MPTQTEKVDSIIGQFNGLSFKSKQLVFLRMLEDLRSNVPRSSPARGVFDEIAKLSPHNKLALKQALAEKRRVQNRGLPKKSNVPRPNVSKPRSPPTPASGPRRKNARSLPGAVNLSTAPPRWYWGPHFSESR